MRFGRFGIWTFEFWGWGFGEVGFIRFRVLMNILPCKKHISFVCVLEEMVFRMGM